MRNALCGSIMTVSLMSIFNVISTPVYVDLVLAAIAAAIVFIPPTGHRKGDA